MKPSLIDFLGDLIKKAGRAVGTFIRSPVGKAVGGWLKGAAKQALPLAGGALGGFVGGPLGAKIGSGLASYAGGALGLEAEMSQEDREFEGAKNFVKLAADAVKSVAAVPPGANPVEAAKAAVRAAVQNAPPDFSVALPEPSPAARSAAPADGCVKAETSSSSTAGRCTGPLAEGVMPAFNPRSEAQSAAPLFGGAVNGGPFAPRSPFSDAEERKLASELLEVTSEAELEQVLGALLRKHRRAPSRLARMSSAP